MNLLKYYKDDDVDEETLKEEYSTLIEKISKVSSEYNF